VREYLRPICYQSWHCHVLEPIHLPLNHLLYLTILSLQMYLSFVYKLLSLLHKQKYYCERYSADTAQMNLGMRSYGYDIALSTTNVGTAA
jgi:hypothetical protein